MPNDAKTIGQLLGSLNSRGIYNVELVENEFARFGFTYNRATDQLKYGRGSVALGARNAEQMAYDLLNDTHGGILEEGLSRRDRMVDAVQLSRAVFRLLFVGETPPSDGFYGRDKGFKADVEAILMREGPIN